MIPRTGVSSDLAKLRYIFPNYFSLGTIEHRKKGTHYSREGGGRERAGMPFRGNGEAGSRAGEGGRIEFIRAIEESAVADTRGEMRVEICEHVISTELASGSQSNCGEVGREVCGVCALRIACAQRPRVRDKIRRGGTPVCDLFCCLDMHSLG